MSTLNVAFGTQIAAAAQRHHLDPRLLAAVAAQETGGPGSDSGRNILGDDGHGRGLFQIDDRWHPFAQSAAAMDPGANAEYAAGLLSRLVTKNGGDVHAALSSYNAGSPHATGTRTTWGDGSILGYADSVLRHFQRLGGGTTPTTSARDTQVAALADSGAQTDALRALFSKVTSQSARGGASQAIPMSFAPHKHASQPQPDPNPGASIIAPDDDPDAEGNVIF